MIIETLKKVLQYFWSIERSFFSEKAKIKIFVNFLIFHVGSIKPTNYKCDERLMSLCTQQGHLHCQLATLDEEIFQHHRKKVII